MTGKYTVPDGQPGGLKPGDRVTFEKDGVIYTDTVTSIAYTSPEAAIWPTLTWWQQVVRRFTPKRFRKPLQPIRPYKPAEITVSTGDENPLERAEAHLGKTLKWMEGLKKP